MAYDYDATYEILKNRFMKNYGTVHLCGNCKYTFVCPRMKIQCSHKEKEKTIQMMREHAPFATKINVELYVPKNCNKAKRFVNVYECDKFVFDRRNKRWSMN